MRCIKKVCYLVALNMLVDCFLKIGMRIIQVCLDALKTAPHDAYLAIDIGV